MAYIQRINRFQASMVPPPSPAATPAIGLNLSSPSPSSSSVSLTDLAPSTPSHHAHGHSQANMTPLNINIEYLKNCIYKYMTTLKMSEKQRLYKVIATILNFTKKEIQTIEESLQEESNANPGDQIQHAITSISTSLDYWFGGSNANNHATAPPPPPAAAPAGPK